MQGLRAKHHIDKRCARNNRRTFLAGNAAAHADFDAFGLEMLDAAQVAEHFFLRFFAHRTGVEQNQISLVHVLGGDIAFGGVQHVDHFVRVVLVHLAAEGFDENFFRDG